MTQASLDGASDSASRPILVLGPGPSEAPALETAAAEACAALRDRGETVVMVAPDVHGDGGADRLYRVPLHADFLERVLAAEKPKSIVFTAAGRSALAAGLALDASNVLRRYGVESADTPLQRLRDLAARPLGLLEVSAGETEIRKSISCRSLDESLRAAEFLGYPVAVRGLKREFAAPDVQTLKEKVRHLLLQEETVLVEEDIAGAQMVTVLVLRGRNGGAMAIGDAEGIDPLSPEPGQPMLAAPAQTIAPELRASLRRDAEHLAEALECIGAAAVVFSVHKQRSVTRAVSFEPGLHRLTALLGHLHDLPLARFHAELMLGRDVRQLLLAPPELRGIAVALPPAVRRLPLHPLTPMFAGERLSGDALGAGRTFGEALQSAVRSLAIGADGLQSPPLTPADMRRELKQPGPRRLLAVASAFEQDWGLNQVHAATGIDLVFLQAVQHTVRLRRELFQGASAPLSIELLWQLKQDGFSDRVIGRIRANQPEEEIASLRRRAGIVPELHFLRADGDDRRTAYLSCREGGTAGTAGRSTILFPVLGPTASPAGRDGDWAVGEAGRELALHGYRTAVVTGNPWTAIDRAHCRLHVAGDISGETLAELRRLAEPAATAAWSAAERDILVWSALAEDSAPAFGTAPTKAVEVDDPRRLATLCAAIGLAAPDWREAGDGESAAGTGELCGYPLLVRGSRGLTGGRTLVAKTPAALRGWFEDRPSVGRDAYVMIAAAGDGELIDIEAVAQDGHLIAFTIGETLERFGAEDGRETTVLPAQRLSLRSLRQLREKTAALAAALRVSGPIGAQFLVQEEDALVVGCQLNAGRLGALTRAATGESLPRLAVRATLGLLPAAEPRLCDGQSVATRVSQPRPGGDESSLSSAPDLPSALLLGFLGLGFSPPERRVLLCVDDLKDLTELLPTVQALQRQGAVLLATANAHEFFLTRSVPTGLLHRLDEPRSPNVREYLEQGRLDVAVAIPPEDDDVLLAEARTVEALAARSDITFVGSMHLLGHLARALEAHPVESLPCRPEARRQAE